MTNEITHGHLLPCLCGAGKPDQGWFGYGAGRETHHVQCLCGDGTTDSTEDGAAAQCWTEQDAADGVRLGAIVLDGVDLLALTP